MIRYAEYDWVFAQRLFAEILLRVLDHQSNSVFLFDTFSARRPCLADRRFALG